MRLCEFEDDGVAGLDPLTLTRPAFSLLCGATTLFQKHRRAFRPSATAALVRPYLSRVTSAEHQRLTVNVSDWLLEGAVTLVNSRWLPPRKFVPPANREMSCVAMLGDEIAYAVLQPRDVADCTPHTITECLAEWKRTLPTRPAGGRLVGRPWDLVQFNGEELHADFLLTPHADFDGRPGTLTLVGSSDLLRVDPTARIDPFDVADSSPPPPARRRLHRIPPRHVCRPLRPHRRPTPHHRPRGRTAALAAGVIGMIRSVKWVIHAQL